MNQAPTDSSAIPDLHMADVARRFSQKWPALSDDCRPFENALPRHRSDAEFPIFNFQVIELVQAIEVNQLRRTRQAHVHHRNQTLSSGQRFSRVAELREQFQGLG